MKLLLDSVKFENVPVGRVGLLVTFPSVGCSQGDKLEDGIHVVVGHCNSCTAKGQETEVLKPFGVQCPDWQLSLDLVSRLYPAGTVAAGICLRIDENKDKEEKEKELQELCSVLQRDSQMKSAFNRQSLLVVSVSGSRGSVSVDAYQLMCPSCKGEREEVWLQPVMVIPASGLHSISRHLVQYAVMLRLTASFPVFFTMQSEEEAFSALKNKLISSSLMLFLPSSGTILPGTAKEAKLSSVLAERFKVANKPPKSESGQRSGCSMSEEPLSVELVESTVCGGGSGELPGGPSVSVKLPVDDTCVLVHVALDCLALVNWDSSVSELVSCFKKGLCKQLESVRDEVFWKPGLVHSASVHHFVLEDQGCPVTIVYPDLPLDLHNPESPSVSLTNHDLRPLREKWLDLLCISRKSPYLRILTRHSKSWLGSSKLKTFGPQLQNPHVEVKPPKVKDGDVALVKGYYLYYHYMQDSYDDNGWGCAYRSLQTLWSWFLLQGFTDKKVPGHRDIQLALVEVGDKEKPFLGSKEWIGSFEVSTVLNQLLGVESKIHFCPGGNQMGSTGRILLDHFRTVGTPVMIGGGVLAHTILGVNFNELMGDVEFLVLDPHYTGRDDLKAIIEKGWCAWKPASFWESSAHYNMCLPQVSEDL